MFEKEAEEYQIRKHHKRLYGNKPVVMKELNMTEYEKQVEISFCEKYLKYLRKPHWSFDILLRPLRIYYYSRKLKKLRQTNN